MKIDKKNSKKIGRDFSKPHMLKRSALNKLAFCTRIAFTLTSSVLSAATINVTNNNDSGPGSFRQALLSANPEDTILFASNVGGQQISLASALPGINESLTIVGPSTPTIIDGGGLFSAFYVQSGIVAITNLKAQNCLLAGGSGGASGGGGGAGTGGALFVNQGATVLIANVILESNTAAGGGGARGNAVSPTAQSGGGGGGFNGGTGGDTNTIQGSTGGGGDLGGQPGANGAPGGGNGGFGGTAGAEGGGPNGGGGGGAGSGFNGSPGTLGTGLVGGDGGSGGGTGGGGGGGAGTVDSGDGGAGAFGGGGGGGGSGGNTGGNGGIGNFGSGGGGGGFGSVTAGTGTVGGFGGGSGGAGNAAGSGGGGGGAGLGGGIFVRNGAALTMVDGAISGNTAQAGAGGVGNSGFDGQNGSGFGQDIFLMSGGSILFTTNGTLTIPTAIQSDQGAGGGSGGGITKNGLGTLILTGTSTYTGTTTVDAGFLQGTTNSLIGNITVNSAGTLVFDQTFAGNFTGFITGAGNVTIQDIGPITFPAANTYSGTTTISSGATLIAGNANVLASSSTHNVIGTLNLNNNNQTIGNLAGSGTVNLGTATLIVGGNNTSTTFSGVIGGTGSLIKQGTGILTLTGANTYSGGTTVNNGTLQGTTTSLQGNFTINALGALSFNQNSSGTFTGNLAGGGSLLKQGTGTVILPGVYTFNGTTTVIGGTLEIDGTLPSEVIVQQAGNLQGVGTVAALSNSGTFSPGNGIGTFTVTGNFTQTSAGNFIFQFDPSGILDQILIGGTATLGGLVSPAPLPGEYTSGQLFTFLTATGGISGTFTLGPVPIISNQRIIPRLVYTPTTVSLLLTTMPTLCSQPIGGNPHQVACYIDQLLLTPFGDLESIVIILNGLSLSQETQALYSMQPSFFGAFAYIEQENASQIAHTVGRRMELLHGNQCLHRPDHRVQVWGDGYGQLFRQHHFHDRTRFSADTEGGIGGADFKIADYLSAGAFGFYDTSHVDWSLGVGRGSAKGAGGGLYTTLFGKGVFVDGLFLAKRSTIDIHRHIEFSSINRTAKSSHKGSTLAGSLKFGWNALEKEILVQPFAELDYVFVREHKIKEKGAGDIDLLVRGRDTSLLRSEAGLNAAYCYARTWMKLIPQIHMSYVRETRFENGDITSQFVNFANLPLKFTVVTGNIDRNLFSRGLELTASFLDNRLTFSGAYTMESDFHKNWIQDMDFMVSFSF